MGLIFPYLLFRTYKGLCLKSQIKPFRCTIGAPIGAWKCFPPFQELGQTDQPKDRPTDIPSHREVKLLNGITKNK